MDMLTGDVPNDKEQVLEALREQAEQQEPTAASQGRQGARRQPDADAPVGGSTQSCRCTLCIEHLNLNPSGYVSS